MELNKAVTALKNGQALVYPTDTAYGLGVDANNFQAVQKLYQIKGRQNQPTHIVVSSLVMAKRYALFSEIAEKIFKNFLPGALTIVLSLRPDASQVIKLLSANSGTIGLRMPNNKIALALVEQLGNPLTATSANPAYGQTPYSIAVSREQFKNKKYQPDLYLDDGQLDKIKPSTIIKIIDDKIELLREGPISKKDIMACF